MKKDLYCISCKKNQTNSRGSAVFTCPICGGYEMVRCKDCRETAVSFTCPACQFIGPA